MTRRALLVQIVLVVALLVALNVAIARLSVNSVPRQLLRAIDASPPVDTVLAGNSLVAAGIDEAAYAEIGAGGRALNIGLGGSSPIEHDLLLRRALVLRPRRVVYGFFDAQLTEPPGVRWSDLFGNRAASFYVGPDIAARFIAPDSSWRRFQFRIPRRVPMFVERAGVWARVERWRRWLHGLGVPPQPAGRFGRVADFAGLEPLTPEAFRRACACAVAERAPLIAPIVDLLAESHRHGAATLVVEMPQAAGHRARYYDTPEWAAYREYVAGEVRRLGGTYLNASDWMPEDAFEDGLHLSPAGARAFSAHLASNRTPGASR
jgi:hypothetical protein